MTPPASRLSDLQRRILWVESPQEILTNKLTTLLSRSEPRDLFDVRALLQTDLDLERACGDAHQKDGSSRR